MDNILTKVEQLACLGKRKSIQFQLNTFLFIIWFSICLYIISLGHNKNLDFIFAGLYYGFLFLFNMFFWNRLSANPLFVQLKRSKLSIIRYMLLLNFKEARFADNSEYYSIKFLMIVYTFCQTNIIFLKIFLIASKSFYSENDKNDSGYDENDKIIIYWFIMFSIAYYSYHQYMIIHNISNYSRNRFSKLRNIISFGYIFSSLYTQFIALLFMNNVLLFISYIILTYLINLIAFLIAYDKPLNIPWLSRRARIIFKGVFLMILFNLNLDNLIIPIYNNALSKYNYFVDTLYYKIYRLLKFLKIALSLLLSYILYTPQFEKQTHYLSSLCIFGVYFIFSIIMICYDALTIFYPTTLNMQNDNNNNNLDVLNDNYQILNEQLIHNNNENKFIQLIQKNSNKQNIFHQLNRINLVTQNMHRNEEINKEILDRIFNSRSKLNYVLAIQDIYWFAKDENNVIFLIKNINLYPIINILQQGINQNLQIFIQILEEIDEIKQKQFILALKINIFQLRIIVQDTDFFSEELLSYVENIKHEQESHLVQIIGYNKYIANYQHVNPNYLLYDLHDQ